MRDKIEQYCFFVNIHIHMQNRMIAFGSEVGGFGRFILSTVRGGWDRRRRMELGREFEGESQETSFKYNTVDMSRNSPSQYEVFSRIFGNEKINLAGKGEEESSILMNLKYSSRNASAHTQLRYLCSKLG